jgi:hypothetical protein
MKRLCCPEHTDGDRFPQLLYALVGGVRVQPLCTAARPALWTCTQRLDEFCHVRCEITKEPGECMIHGSVQPKPVALPALSHVLKQRIVGLSHLDTLVFSQSSVYSISNARHGTQSV